MELTRGLLVTGAGGQLAEALREEFASEHVVALGLEDWDVTLPPPADLPEVDVALHAAAWTDVDRGGGAATGGLQAEAAAGEDAWIVRTSGLFGWTSANFVRTMLRLGGERDEVSVVHDQRTAPTYVGHLAAAVRELLDRPRGLGHLAAGGECTWADFAEAIFEEAGLECRVRRIAAAELGRRAPRPAYSVLRSERPDAPKLPHWREGLVACLERLR